MINISEEIKRLQADECLRLQALTRKAAQAVRSLVNYVNRVDPRDDNLIPSCHWIREDGIIQITLKESEAGT